jgi:hypothetical protein
MQCVSHEPPHGGFSGAHEANEREITDLAGTIHNIGLRSFCPKGTLFL